MLLRYVVSISTHCCNATHPLIVVASHFSVAFSHLDITLSVVIQWNYAHRAGTENKYRHYAFKIKCHIK
jgi:hypothetical protein